MLITEDVSLASRRQTFTDQQRTMFDQDQPVCTLVNHAPGNLRNVETRKMSRLLNWRTERAISESRIHVETDAVRTPDGFQKKKGIGK